MRSRGGLSTAAALLHAGRGNALSGVIPSERRESGYSGFFSSTFTFMSPQPTRRIQ
jgi:hypothetical protein